VAIFRLRPEFVGVGLDGSIAYPPEGRTFDFSAAVNEAGNPGGSNVLIESQDLIGEMRLQIATNPGFPFVEGELAAPLPVSGLGSAVPFGSFGQRFPSRVERRVM